MNTGRPLKYKTAEELDKAIEQYYVDCQKQMRPYTMSGLAVALGIDRRTLLNYSKKDDFFPTIKKARDMVEAFTEEMLLTGKNTAGVIFSLKNNFGWKDKTEVEATNLNYQAQSYEEFINSTKGDEY